MLAALSVGSSTVIVMSLRWYTIVIDAHDVAAQARWWARVLDWVIGYEADDEVVIVPRHAADESRTYRWEEAPQGWVFVPVPEGKTVKNRIHLDLAPHSSDDQAAEVQRLIDAGATRVDVGQDPEQVSWVVLADPEGNEFCVLSPRDR